MGLLLGACASHEPVRTVDSSTYPALPPAVDVAVFTDAEQIKATYRDGVLTVKLPKAEENKPKEIKIEAA